LRSDHSCNSLQSPATIALLGVRRARVYHPRMSNGSKDNRVRSPIVVVRVPPPMLRRIDQFAEARCLGRAEAIRRLLDGHLLPQDEDVPQLESEERAA
jgi:hypothetical protein